MLEFSFLDYKSNDLCSGPSLCHCVVILGNTLYSLHPVSSIITLNYLFIFLYITNNNTEKLMFLPYKSGSIIAVKLVVKSVRLKFK